MSRALTPILIDLTDRDLASAAARRLRGLGFSAAARADDAPDAPPLPRHPSLVVADPHTAVDLWDDDTGLGPGVDVVGATALEHHDLVVAHVLRREPDLVPAPLPRAEEPATAAELVAAIEPFEAYDDGPGPVGGRWVVLVVRAFELPRVAQRYGPAVADRLADHLLRCVDDDLPGVHPVGFTASRDVVVVLDRQRVGRMSRRLEGLAVMLARRRYGSDVTGEPETETLSLTPLLGYAPRRPPRARRRPERRRRVRDTARPRAHQGPRRAPRGSGPGAARRARAGREPGRARTHDPAGRRRAPSSRTPRAAFGTGRTTPSPGPGGRGSGSPGRRSARSPSGPWSPISPT